MGSGCFYLRELQVGAFPLTNDKYAKEQRFCLTQKLISAFPSTLSLSFARGHQSWQATARSGNIRKSHKCVLWFYTAIYQERQVHVCTKRAPATARRLRANWGHH